VPASELHRAAELIRGADALLVCAGAGMGVDSGLPEFRGPEGFWRAYPPYRGLGLRFEELADPVHFDEDPRLAWGFYGHRLALYRAAVPHPGYGVLLSWARRWPLRVFTSNVDGQFQRAGFTANPAGGGVRAGDVVAEVHGSVHRLQCVRPCLADTWPVGKLAIEVDAATMRATGPLPTCPHCGALARPNILMFGDTRWVPAASQRALDALAGWRRSLGSRRLAVLEIGAGTAVPTVRRQAELASAATGALVRINPREPQVRHGRGVALQLGAAEALAALDTLMWA
jgi:NAD-dependent SIR2 family protein deacetylase